MYVAVIVSGLLLVSLVLCSEVVRNTSVGAACVSAVSNAAAPQYLLPAELVPYAPHPPRSGHLEGWQGVRLGWQRARSAGNRRQVRIRMGPPKVSWHPYRLHSLSYPPGHSRSISLSRSHSHPIAPPFSHALNRTNAALPRRVHGPVVTAAAAGGGHTLLLSDKGQLFAVGRWVASPSPAYFLHPPSGRTFSCVSHPVP